MNKKKKILIALLVLLAIFVILDFGYFSANGKFFFRGRTEVYQSPAPAIQPQKKTDPNLLSIASLGIEAPIVYPTANSETAYQAALVNGVAHYPGTPLPGELGNVYIFGHSSDFVFSKGHYKSIFATLPKIALGDQIVVSDPSGNAFTYTVTGSREVAADDLSVLDQHGKQKKLLTLQTSYPVGTALKRWIVIAELK